MRILAQIHKDSKNRGCRDHLYRYSLDLYRHRFGSGGLYRYKITPKSLQFHTKVMYPYKNPYLGLISPLSSSSSPSSSSPSRKPCLETKNNPFLVSSSIYSENLPYLPYSPPSSRNFYFNFSYFYFDLKS